MILNSWQEALSAANIAILYQVQPSPLDVYSFAYDGMSWAFVNLETFPEGQNCDIAGCLKLGGNLMLFMPQALAADFEFQTFQWQGTSWFLIPSANLTSPETALAPRFAVDGQHLVIFTATIASGPFFRTIPVLSVYEWTGNSWRGTVNLTNFTSLVSQPIQLPVGVAVDGSYMLAVLAESSPQRNYMFIYEQSGGSWEEVYGQEVGETSPQGNPIDSADIASSGKVILTGVSRNVRRVFLFERDADGIWGPTQTLVLNETATADDGAVGIGDTAAVVTYFPTGTGGTFFNTTATGKIIGCNSTAPTTPTPSYRYSYYRRFRRARRARCPKWCAAVRWWHWRCRRCKEV